MGLQVSLYHHYYIISNPIITCAYGPFISIPLAFSILSPSPILLFSPVSFTFTSCFHPSHPPPSPTLPFLSDSILPGTASGMIDFQKIPDTSSVLARTMSLTRISALAHSSWTASSTFVYPENCWLQSPISNFHPSLLSSLSPIEVHFSVISVPL